MKKLIYLILFLLLTACVSTANPLEEKYSAEELELIRNLSSNHQEYFVDNYQGDYLAIISFGDFKEELFDDYIEYYRELPLKECIYLVNNRLVNDERYELIKEVINDRYYIADNLKLYINYRYNFDNARELVEWVNTLRYLKEYTDTFEADLSKDILMIANKYYTLGDYVPDDLVAFGAPYCGFNGELRKEARDHYIEMYDAALKDGISMYVCSAYRSYSYQVNLYGRYLTIDPQSVVDTYSARPGFSDHQTGLTVDILSLSYDFGNFYASSAAAWLKDNAYKYGFIMRYPEFKDHITGYEYEPWHYRYVGEEVAKEIYENQITFDEYYAYMVGNEK